MKNLLLIIILIGSLNFISEANANVIQEFIQDDYSRDAVETYDEVQQDDQYREENQDRVLDDNNQQDSNEDQTIQKEDDLYDQYNQKDPDKTYENEYDD